MSNRLNQEREKQLEPIRIITAKKLLLKLGVKILRIDDKSITFLHQGAKIVLWPYSGWFSGKTIKDGRGVKNLINQISRGDHEQRD